MISQFCGSSVEMTLSNPPLSVQRSMIVCKVAAKPLLISRLSPQVHKIVPFNALVLVVAASAFDDNSG